MRYVYFSLSASHICIVRANGGGGKMMVYAGRGCNHVNDRASIDNV